jgi:hypothetical protein
MVLEGRDPSGLMVDLSALATAPDDVTPHSWIDYGPDGIFSPKSHSFHPDPYIVRQEEAFEMYIVGYDLYKANFATVKRVMSQHNRQEFRDFVKDAKRLSRRDYETAVKALQETFGSSAVGGLFREIVFNGALGRLQSGLYFDNAAIVGNSVQRKGVTLGNMTALAGDRVFGPSAVNNPRDRLPFIANIMVHEQLHSIAPGRPNWCWVQQTANSLTGYNMPPGHC